MMKVGVVIPVYQKPEQVEKCLQAVEDSIKDDFEIKIYAISNNEENLGFTHAVNDGLHEAMMDNCMYALVLNQDCYVKPDCIKNLVDFMGRTSCFIAGAKQLSSLDEDKIIHGGCKQAFPNGVHIGGIKSKNQCNKNKRMPWVNGACFMVALSEIPYVGLMDPNYFLIGSDSDWCYTARARKYEVWYCAEAECVHEQGVSTGTMDKELSKQMYLDMFYFRSKWLGSDLFKELAMEVFE